MCKKCSFKREHTFPGLSKLCTPSSFITPLLICQNCFMYPGPLVTPHCHAKSRSFTFTKCKWEHTVKSQGFVTKETSAQMLLAVVHGEPPPLAPQSCLWHSCGEIDGDDQQCPPNARVQLKMSFKWSEAAGPGAGKGLQWYFITQMKGEVEYLCKNTVEDKAIWQPLLLLCFIRHDLEFCRVLALLANLECSALVQLLLRDYFLCHFWDFDLTTAKRTFWLAVCFVPTFLC